MYDQTDVSHRELNMRQVEQRRIWKDWFALTKDGSNNANRYTLLRKNTHTIVDYVAIQAVRTRSLPRYSHIGAFQLSKECILGIVQNCAP